jgi:parallel beta-helix repeat protein
MLRNLPCRVYVVMLKFIFGSSLLFAASLYANEFYISTSGNDANSGDSSAPWKTLSKAAKTLKAGDTVYISEGTYEEAEPIELQESGTAGKPIRFSAAENQHPVIHTLATGFRLKNKQWIEISGLTLVGPFKLPATWKDMPEITVDDSSVVFKRTPTNYQLLEEQINKRFATYVGIKEFLENHWTAGISIEGSSHITIKNNSVSLYSADIQMSRAASDLTIESNKTFYARAGIYAREEPKDSTEWMANGAVISKNEVYQNWNHGFELKHVKGLVIKDNYIHHNAQAHIVIQHGSEDCLIQHNYTEYGGYYSETMKNPGASAISVHTSGPGNVVDGNYTAYTVDYTYIDGGGIIADLMQNGAGVLIQNNIVYRNMGAGITLTKSPGCRVINNICVENGYEGKNPGNVAGFRFSQREATNNIVVNNIFYKDSGGGLSANGLLNKQQQVDYNLYFPAPNTFSIQDGTNKFKSLAEAQRAGYEPHALEADPLFLDPSKDFHLKSDSPALGKANKELLPATDYKGEKRITPNIGVY